MDPIGPSMAGVAWKSRPLWPCTAWTSRNMRDIYVVILRCGKISLHVASYTVVWCQAAEKSAAQQALLANSEMVEVPIGSMEWSWELICPVKLGHGRKGSKKRATKARWHDDCRGHAGGKVIKWSMIDTMSRYRCKNCCHQEWKSTARNSSFFGTWYLITWKMVLKSNHFGLGSSVESAPWPSMTTWEYFVDRSPFETLARNELPREPELWKLDILSSGWDSGQISPILGWFFSTFFRSIVEADFWNSFDVL